ncbi:MULTISPECIES: hypothetical protein [unclassified Thioalkalivibrio]|uniref:hypothetical protein n=1 Tax=unclassified Thioalkalivibrio TaxID=2621013 RepID=UPI00037ED2F9|nr:MULTISPECIES: hypothetical protein [unclassified Thioalkalivibrio]
MKVHGDEVTVSQEVFAEMLYGMFFLEGLAESGLDEQAELVDKAHDIASAKVAAMTSNVQ